MESVTKSLVRKFFVILGFIAIVTVKIINEIGTSLKGNISGSSIASALTHRYTTSTLFTPKNYTFYIWIAIYALLLIYVLYQFFIRDHTEEGIQSKITVWFVISCAANIVWTCLWENNLFLWSVLAIGMLLFCLINILSLISGTERTLGSMAGLEIPFGLYTGWITVSIANSMMVLLMNLDWDRFHIPEYIYAMVMVLLTAFVALAITNETLNLAYPLAVIWGFVGILTRYVGQFTWDVSNQSTWITAAVVLGILILALRFISMGLHRLKAD